MSPEEHAPDFSRGFLRVPLAVWVDLYCRAPVTRRQLQLVSVVLRESWGWQTRGGQVRLWTRPLSPGQFAALTGLSTDHLTRDLAALVAAGLLREHERRYQLVADSRLWKTPAAPPPKPRPRALKSPAHSAKTALPRGGLKTGKIKQRNVLPFPERELSPAVENSRRESLAPVAPQARIAPAELSEPFAAVIAAFVGALSPGEQEQLRQWVRREGVLAVWAALAPAFRRGPDTLRQVLQDRLREAPGRPR